MRDCRASKICEHASKSAPAKRWNTFLSLRCCAICHYLSFHRYCFVFFKLALPKQHSFTLIPLALKARLPSMYHLRRELRFTSTCAYMYVARFTISGKKKSNPLIRGPCTFWMYPAAGSLLQCNLLPILQRLIFQCRRKVTGFAKRKEIFFSGYP